MTTIDSVRALGLEAPTDAADLADLAGRLRDLTVTAEEPGVGLLADYQAGKLAKLTPERLAARIVEAVAKSDDAKAARGAAQRLAEQVERDADVALRAHADELIEAYRPAFDAAADVIEAAREVGITSSTTAGDALQLGTAAGQAYLGLAAANAALSAARGLIVEVTGLSGHLLGVERFLDVASLDRVGGYRTGFEAVTAVDKASYIWHEPSASVWLALLEAGYSLHLNTAKEVADVIAAGHAQRSRIGRAS